MSKIVTNVIQKEVNTSAGVCTPRYILDKPTKAITRKRNIFETFFLVESANVPYNAVAA